MEQVNRDFGDQEVSPGIVDKSASKSMTQTQIGTIGEMTVAAQLMLASDGRFSPWHCHINFSGLQFVQLGAKVRPPCPRFAKRRTMRFEALYNWAV